MITVDMFEAKANFNQLLEQVSNGQMVTVTRDGVPVARLVGVGETEPAAPSYTIDRIRQLSKGVTLDGIPIRDLIDDGRR